MNVNECDMGKHLISQINSLRRHWLPAIGYANLIMMIVQTEVDIFIVHAFGSHIAYCARCQWKRIVGICVCAASVFGCGTTIVNWKRKSLLKMAPVWRKWEISNGDAEHQKPTVEKLASRKSMYIYVGMNRGLGKIKIKEKKTNKKWTEFRVSAHVLFAILFVAIGLVKSKHWHCHRCSSRINVVLIDGKMNCFRASNEHTRYRNVTHMQTARMHTLHSAHTNNHKFTNEIHNNNHEIDYENSLAHLCEPQSHRHTIAPRYTQHNF